MSTPSASPTHQRLETTPHWLAGKVPPRIRIPVPTAADASGDSNAVPAIAATSSKCPRNLPFFEIAVNSQTPAKARNELAKASPSAGAHATDRSEVVTKYAATSTGQKRGPNTSSATRSNPAAGHTGVRVVPDSNSQPSLDKAKWATNSGMPTQAYGRFRSVE